MTFADNINRICKEKGTNLTDVIKKVKGSSSFATAINKGSLPKEKEMAEMAKILNCSVMEFFSDSETVEKYKQQSQLSDDEKDIIRIFRMLNRPQQHTFMAAMYECEQNVKGNV